MLVKELIEALQKMPQDAKVIITDSAAGRWDSEVRDVIYNDPAKLYPKHPDAGTVELDNWPATEYF